MDLAIGRYYTLTTHDWQSPLGDTIGGHCSVRRVLGRVVVGGTDFYKVQRPNGSPHLIACNEIREALPVPCAHCGEHASRLAVASCGEPLPLCDCADCADSLIPSPVPSPRSTP